MIQTVFMYISAILSFLAVGFMVYKKIDIKLTLFAVGLFLMYVATAMGYQIKVSKVIKTGFVVLDPIKAIIDQFIKTLQRAGIIILFLSGYSAYMTKMGANHATIKMFTKPLSKVKSPYILVPIVFILSNLLSLVVPSASMLAVILLATLYPILKETGMSRLTGAALIATAATIMPTPLGGDNIVVAKELNMSTSEYVFKHHAVISLPTIIVMAVAHYFTQKAFDKRDIKNGVFQKIEILDKNLKNEKNEIKGKVWSRLYAFLPLLPIFILFVSFIINLALSKDSRINITVAIATILCVMICMAIESIKFKSCRKAINQFDSFFKGMANSFGVIILLVAASIFVVGLKSIGLVSTLQKAMEGMSSRGIGWVLPLALVTITFLIVILSGSGVALFYAMVPLMVGFATSAGIAAQAVTIPMGLSGNLFRAISPVSAVVVIISARTNLSTISIVKRTAIPSIIAAIFMFTLSMIVYL